MRGFGLKILDKNKIFKENQRQFTIKDFFNEKIFKNI